MGLHRAHQHTSYSMWKMLLGANRRCGLHKLFKLFFGYAQTIECINRYCICPWLIVARGHSSRPLARHSTWKHGVNLMVDLLQRSITLSFLWAQVQIIRVTFFGQWRITASYGVSAMSCHLQLINVCFPYQEKTVTEGNPTSAAVLSCPHTVTRSLISLSNHH